MRQPGAWCVLLRLAGPAMRPAFDKRVYPNYRVRFPARETVPCSRGAREHAPRPRAGRLPLAPDHGAVDDHRVDAFRALNRLREGRRFIDFIFIEHDDIRGETLLQDAPVR